MSDAVHASVLILEAAGSIGVSADAPLGCTEAERTHAATEAAVITVLVHGIADELKRRILEVVRASPVEQFPGGRLHTWRVTTAEMFCEAVGISDDKLAAAKVRVAKVNAPRRGRGSR